MSILTVTLWFTDKVVHQAEPDLKKTLKLIASPLVTLMALGQHWH